MPYACGVALSTHADVSSLVNVFFQLINFSVTLDALQVVPLWPTRFRDLTCSRSLTFS